MTGTVRPVPVWDPDRGFIARPRVGDRLRGWSGYPLLLAVAPAGYGKTSAIAEWVSEDPRRSAWLTVDRRDDDPVFFAGTIAAALHEIEPFDQAVFDALSAPVSGASEAVVPRLVEAIAERQVPFVLVLDDLHHVEADASLALVAALARAVPAGSQIVATSRVEPEINLGRLRAEGVVAELDRKALSMTRSEARAVLAGFGIELDDDPLSRLMERTEGWPVALYLSARSLEGYEDPGSAVTDLAGDERIIADYLRDELLASADADDVDFMVSCSVLDHLSGDACDRVTDRSGSAGDLRRLSRSNLLVVPLDGADREFRFHGLFREMLRGELARRGEREAGRLHARASEWYASAGDVDRAIDHAIRAGGDADAATLIFAATPDYVSHGRDATLARFLGNFSEEEQSSSPPLALTQATRAMTAGQGEEARRWTTAARDGIERVPVELRELAGAVADLVEGAAATFGEPLHQMQAAVTGAKAVIPQESPWVSLACLIEGVAEHIGANPERARAVLEDGARRSAATVPTVHALCLAQLSLLSLETGRETEAWAFEERAVATIERYALWDLPTQVLVVAAAALVRARRGRVDEAVLLTRRADALLARIPGLSYWFEAETRIVLAEALHQLDDPAAARRKLEEAERFVAAIPDPGLLREGYERVLDKVGESTGGQRWPLTPAELRLLHLLPTHLSFREIAAELYVSTNTVKSQARSIYRKLGAVSRAEAVASARAAGLVPDGDSGTLRSGVAAGGHRV